MRDWKPIVFGVVVSTILAATLTIAGLKAGITPGVSPLVILVAWGAFTASIRTSGRRFLNLAQVAGSAGMAVCAGVIFTAPLLQILYKSQGLEVPAPDVVTLIIVSLGGAFMGFGFVGLATKKFLTDPTLPAPEARACEKMIEAAVTNPDARPKLGTSLVAGLVASFLAPLIVKMGAATEHVVLWTRKFGEGDDARNFKLDLPFTPIYIGIGGLLTLGTALLVAGGSFLRLFGDGMLTTETLSSWPANSMRWVGGGAMTVAVAYSLVRFMGPRKPAAVEEVGDPALLEVDKGILRRLVTSVIFGTAILVGWLMYREGGVTLFGISMSAGVLVMATLMVTLGAILSLQIGSSASPVSGTVFVTTLALCLIAVAVGRTKIADVELLMPLLVGACVAVCTANDSSQDYKTMQFCGVRVQDGFLAQILGLIGGCIAVPLALYVAFKSSESAGGFGSDAMPAPQGKMFATLIEGLLIKTQLPWAPIIVGLVIGGFAVMVDILADKRGIQLPSMAFAVGIYLPAYLGVGILIGAFFRWLGERKNGKQTSESILAAAGLITGAAALELILGTIVVLGGDPDAKLKILGFGAEVQNVVAVLGILSLGLLLYVNSLPQRSKQ